MGQTGHIPGGGRSGEPNPARSRTEAVGRAGGGGDDLDVDRQIDGGPRHRAKVQRHVTVARGRTAEIFHPFPGFEFRQAARRC